MFFANDDKLSAITYKTSHHRIDQGLPLIFIDKCKACKVGAVSTNQQNNAEVELDDPQHNVLEGNVAVEAEAR